MSSTDSVEGVQETCAQAYARALEAWGQWLRHWRRTGAPRALHATLVCKQIASEKFAAWRAELLADRSARQAVRATRTALALDQTLGQIRRDEQALDYDSGVRCSARCEPVARYSGGRTGRGAAQPLQCPPPGGRHHQALAKALVEWDQEAVP